jgi:MoaA/NifB/PqqE/SkfB family radical SAM enzyme
MFSLHTPDPERLNAFMGKPTAWETMSRAVTLCHDAGVPVAFNTCAGPEAFGNGEFDRLMRCARDFGACLVQLIKPKPAGAWLSSPPPEFSSADFARLYEVVNRYNHDPGFADFPAISAQVIEEDRDHFGCTAGGVDRFYINAKGDVQPCEFLNISFGNLGRESFDAIFARMRRRFDPPGENWLCEGCALHVRQVAQSKPRLNLPLSAEDSEVIAAKWDRGQPTRAYERIHRLR